MVMMFRVLRPQILLGLVISKRAKIKEKEKLKSIYLQPFVSRSDKSILSYQQIIFVQKIATRKFLKESLKEEVRFLYKKFEIGCVLRDEKDEFKVANI